MLTEKVWDDGQEEDEPIKYEELMYPYNNVIYL